MTNFYDGTVNFNEGRRNEEMTNMFNQMIKAEADGGRCFVDDRLKKDFSGRMLLDLSSLDLGVCIGEWDSEAGSLRRVVYKDIVSSYDLAGPDVYFTLNEYAHPETRIVLNLYEVSGIINLIEKRIRPSLLFQNFSLYRLDNFYRHSELTDGGQWLKVTVSLSSGQYLDFFTECVKYEDGRCSYNSLVDVNGLFYLEMKEWELECFCGCLVNAKTCMEMLDADMRYGGQIFPKIANGEPQEFGTEPMKDCMQS